MTRMTMIQALRSAMDVMLKRDPDVVIYGQDVGYFGGVFRCTEGLQARYGKSRVFDAPVSALSVEGVVAFADRLTATDTLVGQIAAPTGIGSQKLTSR